MRRSIVTFAVEQGEHANQLPMNPIMYGVVALAVLIFLLLVTFAFRSVRTRHR